MRIRFQLLMGAALLAFCPLTLFTRFPAHASPVDPVPASHPNPGASVEQTLPPGILPGLPVRVPVEGDKPVLVIHAPAGNRRAIVYLHGMCGNVQAVETWKRAASQHGTLIALVGDRQCGSGRFKWNKKVDGIQARIERAFETVRAVRGGLLDTSDLVLFGYSQGADRASVLVRNFPGRYRRVVLGGPSRQPKLVNLGETEAVAVFGGELETTGHMRLGAEILSAAGKPARFFVLPAAKHGEYGPEGNRVMNEVLSWIVDWPNQAGLTEHG